LPAKTQGSCSDLTARRLIAGVAKSGNDDKVIDIYENLGTFRSGMVIKERNAVAMQLIAVCPLWERHKWAPGPEIQYDWRPNCNMFWLIARTAEGRICYRKMNKVRDNT
jgi:hypothetical protein